MAARTRSTIVVWVVVVSSWFIGRNTIISSHFTTWLSLSCLILGCRCSIVIWTIPILIIYHILNLVLNGSLCRLCVWLISCVIVVCWNKSLLICIDILLACIIVFHLSIPSIGINVNVNDCITSLCRCSNLWLSMWICCPFLPYLLWI